MAAARACQRDRKHAGAPMQNELGQLVKVTDVLGGREEHMGAFLWLLKEEKDLH